MVENVNSRFWIPVDIPGTVRLSTGSLVSSVDEKPTTIIALAATTSYPLTQSASSPSSPTLCSPPTTVASSPPAATVREEDAPLSLVPFHGNLGQNYAAPSKDQQMKRSVTLSAKFLALEGLQKLIRYKEELTSERDQLLAERDQTVARLSNLEARAAEAVVLEARLQQSEQEVDTLSQEIALLRVQFEEARAKCVEIHNVVLDASNHEATSAEMLNNLEAGLNSKIEDLAAAGVKYAQLEEKHKKTIEHHRLFSSIVRDLDVSLQSVRSIRESLSAEVDQLKEELKRRAASLVVEKTYAMS
ncbi:uncharacterized protein [Nicotiana tomentosiformis]|uniref:uncharacterized protein n=1 Tax=Nicotiana tomentosiformis TaxID=4098 RepID=UPI00388CB811